MYHKEKHVLILMHNVTWESATACQNLVILTQAFLVQHTRYHKPSPYVTKKDLLPFFVSYLSYSLLSSKLPLDMRSPCIHICTIVFSGTRHVLPNFLFTTHQFSWFWGSFHDNSYLCLISGK